MNHTEIVSFLWGVADLIRDDFKRGKYQDVILPLTVLRRLDCVLEPTKKQVLGAQAKYKAKLQNPDGQLRRASGFAFYNTSQYDFKSLLADAPHIADNLRNYIAGFSPNMREVIEKFDFDNTIAKLKEAKLLFLVVERFGTVDLHPDRISNAQMGTIFEELIRKFNEALDENPGEHFTPRDVVHLMVDLLLTGDEDKLKKPNVSLTICDPCCGTGGMLTIAKEHILGNARPPINARAEVFLFGQEVNPETFAVCKSDLYMKSADGRDAENVLFGSTLAADPFVKRTFDYQIANPPYGKDWKKDQEAVEAEAERGDAGRFVAGLPRISDGQLLFLQHMVAHMRPTEDGGARVAIIMNGSPLFTGDAGSGETEIRRWILENDLLEALVALPEQLFYNTGIATYVWVLSNHKPKARRGKVLLVDATAFWSPMRKSLGNKRREVPADKAAEILRLVCEFKDGAHSRVYPTTHFAYRKVTVERPLRLNFEGSIERINRLLHDPAFEKLTAPRNREARKAGTDVVGQAIRGALIDQLAHLLPRYMDRAEFIKAFDRRFGKTNMVISGPMRKLILSALSERDETAEVCRDADGNPEPDPELRDFENVPFGEDIAEFVARDVTPFVPDAWVNGGVRDHKDSGVGKVGYEINFNRYFYQYVPPRPLEEIEVEIRALEKEIMNALGDVTG